VSTLVSIGAGWPAIKDISAIASLQDDPTVFAFYGGQDIWDTFAESDANVASRWQWPPLVSSLYTAITDNMKAAIDSGRPITEAFTEAQADMVAALTDAGISVAG
jgi:multiple sugar transport system substrate-binding protein